MHRGGLSSREGLAALIHDGFKQGSREIPAIEDKRLWVIESEFANDLVAVLASSRALGGVRRLLCQNGEQFHISDRVDLI